MKEDVQKELYSRMIKAQADVDQKRQETMICAENVYAHPRDALTRMMAYSRKYGDAALVTQLEAKPKQFGAMKGHWNSGEFFTTQGIRDQKIAKELVSNLPGLVKSTLELDNRALELERAVAAGRADGPSRGKGGLGFT